ncbi:endonuclease domain-containing protein [Actinomadura sp. 3N407]|uniref:endonuclease domain-containing protein n=1 Tax=Actinomadura sp. 3N407 TaxID=3457423 RepID=UPI003FCCC5B3
MDEGFVQYRKKHGWGRPNGDCLICGKSPHPLVHDHCHRHGWVRGRIGVGICNYCNGLMQALDRGALPGSLRRAPDEAYIKHWLRCPDCRELGWKVTAVCACDQSPEPCPRHECDAPPTDPPCPWIGTEYRRPLAEPPT